MCKGGEDYEEEVKKLEEENEKLREALKLYANPNNWSREYKRQGIIVRQSKVLLSEDGGERARQALEAAMNIGERSRQALGK